MRHISSAIFLICFIPALIFGAQTTKQTKQADAQSKTKDEVVRISVTLVQVDAVVTDAKGRLVTDLKPEDFEISEDGRPQRISNFSYVETSSARAPQARPSPIKKEKSNAASVRPLPPSPPVVSKPENIKRTMALVIDDLGLSLESLLRTKTAIKKFIDEQMQPGDLVALLRTSAGMGAMQMFTEDKRILYAALERVHWSPYGRGKVGIFDQMDNTTTDGQREGLQRGSQLRDNFFSVGTFGALSFIVRGLKDLPGRKSAILFSEGFRIFVNASQNENPAGGQQTNDQLKYSLRRLTDLANRSSVVIYTIDPRGLINTEVINADDAVTATDVATHVADITLRARANEIRETQQGLRHLAEETGGFAIRNSNLLDKALSRVLDDQKGYYLIGYTPEENTFKKKSGETQFHNISVRVKRAGLTARYRTGFFGVADEEAQPVRLTRRSRLAGALTSPFNSGDIRVRLTSLFSNSAAKGSFVRSLLHIDLRDFTFREEPGGWKTAVMDIAAYTYDDQGRQVDQINKTFTIRARGKEYADSLREGLVYILNLPLKKSGGFQVRAAVSDVESGRVGSANQFIETPNVGKGQFALSGIVIRADKTAGTIAGGSPAKATADERESEGAEEGESQSGPAVRRFKRGTRCDYTFLAFNPIMNKASGKPDLQIQLTVFEDGKPVYTTPNEPFSPGDQKDSRRLAYGGKLGLGGLKPGHYVLQIALTDKLASQKHNMAYQWIDFEIAD